MANKTLFATSKKQRALGWATVRNHENAPAYALSAEETLAKLACTAFFNETYYVGAAEQLDLAMKLGQEVDVNFLAKTAVYAREQGKMKDIPAMLLAVLSNRSPELFEKVFFRVIDDPKMLKNFVQIVRSGVTGRKSLGSQAKRLVCKWLEERSDESLFHASVGNQPSLADVIRLAHPKPQNDGRRALYGYLTGNRYEKKDLPVLVNQYEQFRRGESLEIPSVPFQLLTSLPLSANDWKQIALRGGWQMVRMNLNTFNRHGALDDERVAANVAAKLANADKIRQARVFPYQLMAAYISTRGQMPAKIERALEKAMEVALENIPEIWGTVYVACDVSGSMSSPVTGYRNGSTSMIRCIDVAALVASALMRKNRRCEVIPFENDVMPLNLSHRNSVMENAEKLASIGGGGTNCSAPLRMLNARKAKGDLVIYVSDNESWVDARSNSRSTNTMIEWVKFKERNKDAKLVCIDLTPNRSVQAQSGKDILNIGGFSDQVFEVISKFVNESYESKKNVADVVKSVKI